MINNINFHKLLCCDRCDHCWDQFKHAKGRNVSVMPKDLKPEYRPSTPLWPSQYPQASGQEEMEMPDDLLHSDQVANCLPCFLPLY